MSQLCRTALSSLSNISHHGETCLPQWSSNLSPSYYECGALPMNITPDLPFPNMHIPFTNKRINIYLDKHSCMPLDTKDNFVIIQISRLSKGMVIVASA